MSSTKAVCHLAIVGGGEHFEFEEMRSLCDKGDKV